MRAKLNTERPTHSRRQICFPHQQKNLLEIFQAGGKRIVGKGNCFSWFSICRTPVHRGKKKITGSKMLDYAPSFSQCNIPLSFKNMDVLAPFSNFKKETPGNSELGCQFTPHKANSQVPIKYLSGNSDRSLLSSDRLVPT